MAGVDDFGFTSKTYDVLVSDITTRANSTEYFGADFPTDPDSAFGVHAGVIAGSLVDLWNLGQNVADQQNVDLATGIYLDHLGTDVGVIRNQSSGSSGNILFGGVEGYTVLQGTQVRDNGGRAVASDEDTVLNKTAAYSVILSPVSVVAFTNYSVTINGTNVYTYATGASDTIQDITMGLEVLIDADFSVNADTFQNDEILSIKSEAELNNVEFGVTSNLTVEAVGVLAPSTSIVTGPLSFPATTLQSLVSTNPNISSVSNPSSFIIGTDLESDEGYRLRIKTRQQVTGTATKPSIEASLLQVDGVTSAYVSENTTVETIEGQPAKSYECFVTGGSETNIANEIWRTKPAGIATYGNIPVTVLDENGDEQIVLFSRANELNAWVRITYTLNPEETFGGESAMELAVVEKGISMYAGEDLVGSKFYGALYNVPGHFISSVEVAVTQYSGSTPTYTTDPIGIPVTTSLLFVPNRIEFV